MPKIEFSTNLEKHEKIYNALKKPFGTEELKKLVNSKTKLLLLLLILLDRHHRKLFYLYF
jgi:hypothetical protein